MVMWRAEVEGIRRAAVLAASMYFGCGGSIAVYKCQETCPPTCHLVLNQLGGYTIVSKDIPLRKRREKTVNAALCVPYKASS